MYVSLKLVSAAAAWPFSESQKSVIRALFKEIRSLLLGASALAAAGIGVPLPGGRASWVNGTARSFALSAALLGLLGGGVAFSLVPAAQASTRRVAQGPVAVEQQDRVLFTFRTAALSVERSAISSI